MTTPATWTVEIGLASATSSFILDTSVLDTGVLGSDLGYNWVDITQWVILDQGPMTFARGTTRSSGPWWRYEGGRAAIQLDNADGRFDPLNLSGPYVSSGISEIRPGLPVRISMVYNAGTPVVQFTGTVDAVDLDYQSMTWGTARFLCTDGVEFLQAADLPELTSPVGAGETAAARIGRILDRAGWPDSARDLDTWSANTMQGTTMAQASWAQILLTADSDAGYVWIAKDGTLVYRTRGGISPSPSLYVSSTGTSTAVQFTSISISHDKEQVFNAVTLARAGGSAQYVEDLTAQALVDQVRGHSRSDLVCEDDSQVNEVATWVLGMFAELQVRVESVTFEPLHDDASTEWAYLRDLEIGQVVRVTHQTPDGRTIVRDGIVRGLAWECGLMRTKLTVSLQSLPDVFTPFVLDSATQGILDTSQLALSTPPGRSGGWY